MTASSVVVNPILQRHHQVEMIKTPSSRCGRGSQGTKDWRGVTGQGLEVTASGRQGVWALGSGLWVKCPWGAGVCREAPGGAGALLSGWAPAPGRSASEPHLGLVRPCSRAAMRHRPLSEVAREALSAPPSSSIGDHVCTQAAFPGRFARGALTEWRSSLFSFAFHLQPCSSAFGFCCLWLLRRL